MYYTYILYSVKLNKYYIGSTDNLERRLAEHNRGKGNFTKTGIPWVLSYSKIFETRNEAVGFEKYIKKRKSREYIENLIKMSDSGHPVL